MILLVKSRKVERKGYGKEFRLFCKWDVGVNCLILIIIWSLVVSLDELFYGKFEDVGI